MSADVALDGAGEILAGLPFAHIRSRITGSRRVCVPFSDVCGPAARDGEEPAIGRVLEQARARHERDGIDAEIRAPLPALDLWGRGSARHTLPLDPDVDIVRRTITASVRRRVARAEREGITLSRRPAQRHSTRFTDCTCAPASGSASPPSPSDSSAASSACSPRTSDSSYSPSARDRRSPPLCSHIQRRRDVQVLRLEPRSSQEGPNNALLMEAIRWGCHHGYHTFDMGRTDLDNKGLRSFKRGWGAQEDVLTSLACASPGATRPQSRP